MSKVPPIPEGTVIALLPVPPVAPISDPLAIIKILAVFEVKLLLPNSVDTFTLVSPLLKVSVKAAEAPYH